MTDNEHFNLRNFLIDGERYVSLCEFKNTFFPGIGKSAFSNRAKKSRAKCIKANEEQLQILKKDHGPRKGGYFLLSLCDAKNILSQKSSDRNQLLLTKHEVQEMDNGLSEPLNLLAEQSDNDSNQNGKDSNRIDNMSEDISLVVEINEGIEDEGETGCDFREPDTKKTLDGGEIVDSEKSENLTAENKNEPMLQEECDHSIQESRYETVPKDFSNVTTSETASQFKLTDSTSTEIVQPKLSSRSHKRRTVRDNELDTCIRREIDSFKKFWTMELNPKRATQAICNSTISKVEERLRQFLWFVSHKKEISLTSLTVCAEIGLCTEYIDYLSTERNLSKGTQTLMVQSLLYVCKWLESSDNYQADYSSSVSGLRNLQSQLQRGYEQLRRKKQATTPVLKMHWAQVLNCLRQLKYDYDNFSGKCKLQHARLCQEFLCLLLFSTVSPNRNLDFILIRIIDERISSKNSKSKNSISDISECNDKEANFLVIKKNGEMALEDNIYKTVKTYGLSNVELTEISYLCRYLLEFIDIHRKRLIFGEEHNFLFVNTDGEPFETSGQFTTYVNKIFQNYFDINNVGFSQLRHSVVTYFLSEKKVTDDMKSSLSRLMKHSSRTQKLCYNVPDVNEQKIDAIRLLSQTTAQMIGEEESQVEDSKDDESDPPQINQIVACVDSSSTAKSPQIYLGKVVGLKTRQRIAVLAEMENLHYMKHNHYILKIGSTFSESYNALVYPVDVIYKDKLNLYELRTSKKDIHNYIFENLKTGQ